MARAQAEANQSAMKAAQKKLGVKPPKHITSEAQGTQLAGQERGDGTDGATQLSESEMQAIHAGRRATDPIIGHLPTAGDSMEAKPVVESGFSIFNQRAGAQQMTEAQTHSSDKPETKPSPSQIERDAKIKADIEAKAKRKAEADEKRAADKKAREDAAALRAQKIAENKAAREARAAELKAAGRTYVGSMTQLADRVKQGAYVKSMTGQLRSTDELAVALDAVPAANVVILGLKALKLAENPYTALNIGQQSMNLRNRMRGAIKKGTLTLDEVKNIRDQDGLATAEAEAAKKKEAAAERAKKAEEAKAAKLQAEQKALEAKQLKEAEALKAKVTQSTKPEAASTEKPPTSAKKATKAQAAA